MHNEPTNLHRVVAQNLLWIQGVTSMNYDILESRIKKQELDGEVQYSFDVVTNSIRVGRIKHPMALVLDTVHVAMTGRLAYVRNDITFDEVGGADIEIDDMVEFFLKADNSGLCNVAVQTKYKTFDGEYGSITRQFMYKNNMLFQIR